MDLVKELKKLQLKEVTIFGEGALYLYHELPGMPVHLTYTAPSDYLRPLEGRRLQPECTKIDYHFATLKYLPEVKFLHSIDIACYAIHVKDVDTLVEYMLCNLESFDSNIIRKRYAYLYSPLTGMAGTTMSDVTCVMPIETYFHNTKDSNIARYMRKHGLSYADFCTRTPGICATLHCSEYNLNSAISELL